MSCKPRSVIGFSWRIPDWLFFNNWAVGQFAVCGVKINLLNLLRATVIQYQVEYSTVVHDFRKLDCNRFNAFNSAITIVDFNFINHFFNFRYHT